MNFELLVKSISDVQCQLQAQAVKSVNMGLTLRNWLIGAYISEYELCGEDRAKYGEGLILKLSKSLKAKGITACEQQSLSSYRLVYRAFPQIQESLAPEFGKLLPLALLATEDEPSGGIHRTLSGESPDKVENVTASPQIASDPIVRSPTGKSPQMLHGILNPKGCQTVAGGRRPPESGSQMNHIPEGCHKGGL